MGRRESVVVVAYICRAIMFKHMANVWQIIGLDPIPGVLRTLSVLFPARIQTVFERLAIDIDAHCQIKKRAQMAPWRFVQQQVISLDNQEFCVC